MSDKLDIIYDLLKQDREEGSEFRKEVRDSHKETSKRLTTLEVQGEVQNKLIDEHIAGVKTLKQLHLDNVGKIEANQDDIVVLKKPAMVRSAVKKWIIGLGSIAGACIAIAKLLGMF